MNRRPLADSGGSFSWLTEGLDDEVMTKMTVEDARYTVMLAVDQCREDALAEIEEMSKTVGYPHFGYTTADVMQTPDEYIAYHTADFEAELADSIEDAVSYIMSRCQEVKDATMVKRIIDCGEGLNYGSFGDKWNADFDIEEQVYNLRHYDGCGMTGKCMEYDTLAELIEAMKDVAEIAQWISDSEDPELEG